MFIYPSLTSKSIGYNWCIENEWLKYKRLKPDRRFINEANKKLRRWNYSSSQNHCACNGMVLSVWFSSGTYYPLFFWSAPARARGISTDCAGHRVRNILIAIQGQMRGHAHQKQKGLASCKFSHWWPGFLALMPLARIGLLFKKEFSVRPIAK